MAAPGTQQLTDSASAHSQTTPTTEKVLLTLSSSNTRDNEMEQAGTTLAEADSALEHLESGLSTARSAVQGGNAAARTRGAAAVLGDVADAPSRCCTCCRTAGVQASNEDASVQHALQAASERAATAVHARVLQRVYLPHMLHMSARLPMVAAADYAVRAAIGVLSVLQLTFLSSNGTDAASVRTAQWLIGASMGFTMLASVLSLSAYRARMAVALVRMRSTLRGWATGAHVYSATVSPEASPEEVHAAFQHAVGQLEDAYQVHTAHAEDALAALQAESTRGQSPQRSSVGFAHAPSQWQSTARASAQLPPAM